MAGIGLWELVVILLIVLVVFGASRLPEIGKALGNALREFKKAVAGEPENGASSEAQKDTPKEP